MNTLRPINNTFNAQCKKNVESLSATDDIDSGSDSEYTLNENSLENGSPKKIGKQGSKKISKSSQKFSRKIKDRLQMQFLEEFFKLDPEWTKSTINFISEFMNLTSLQLYKWGYDQKRKNSWKKGIRSKVRENRRLASNEDIADYNLIVDQLFPEIESKNNSNIYETKMSFEKLRDKYFSKTENLSTLEEDNQVAYKNKEDDKNEVVLHFDSDLNLENYNILPEFNIKGINSFENYKEGVQSFFYDSNRIDCFIN